MVASLLIGVYLAQDQIRHALVETGDRRMLLVTGTFLCLMITGAHYAKGMLQVPLAANNIYEQQFQMHRFVNDSIGRPSP
jgi:hypothetical protein